MGDGLLAGCDLPAPLQERADTAELCSTPQGSFPAEISALLWSKKKSLPKTLSRNLFGREKSRRVAASDRVEKWQPSVKEAQGLYRAS